MNKSQQFLKELGKKLWTATDKLRSNLNAAVHKYAFLSLIVEMLEPFKTRVYDPAIGRYEEYRNAETLITQSSCPSISSALSAFQSPPTGGSA